MSILNRYIIITIIKHILVVLAVLATIYIVFEFLDEIYDVGTENYSLDKALVFIVLSLPIAMYDFLPLAVLIGIILGLSKFTETKEIIAIYASGLGMRYLLSQSLKAGLLFIFIYLTLNELFAFKLYNFANEYKFKALKHNYNSVSELWGNKGNRFFYMKFNNDDSLKSIKLIHVADNKLKSIISSDSIDYKNNKLSILNANKITLYNNSRIVNKNINTKLNLLPKSNYIFANKEPKYINSYNLLQYISNNDAKAKYRLVLYNRIMMPILLIAMTILGLVFVFGTLKELSLGRRIFIGIVFSLVFNLIIRLISEIAITFGYNIFFSVFLPVLILLILSLLALRYRLSTI